MRTMRSRLITVLAVMAIAAPALGSALPAHATSTPVGEENRYRLTIPTAGEGCENSEGRSAGQYAEDCYLP
jgi:hypothetical protein